MAISPRSSALLGGDDVLESYRLNSALRKSARPTSAEEWSRALLQQNTTGAPVGSPLVGLAKMLTAGVGGYYLGQSERAGDQSEAQMLADMMGRKTQQQAEEQRQLAGAGVPGFKMPMAPVEPGVARAVPTAMGGAETVPQGFDAPPTPAPANVDAALIQAVAAMQAGGNKTAGAALPGLQYAYGDIRDREREARQEAAASAREARMAANANRESFGQPTTMMGPDNKPVLVQVGNRGSIRPVSGGFQPPPETPPGAFAGTSTEAQAYNIVLAPNADRASPVYAAAYHKLFGPRQVVAADGTITTIRPEAPPGILPPLVGGQPTQPVAPPPETAPTAGTAPAQAVTETAVPGATVTRTGAGRETPLTEAQSKSNMFGLAMTEGSRILNELKEPPSSAVIAAWRNLPEGALNVTLSSKDQQYFNALRQFAAGVLRKETGAAFTPNELLDVQSRFFAMPGDKPEMRAQKDRARKQAIEAMRAEIPGGFRGQIAAPTQAPGLDGAQPPPPTGGARVIEYDASGRRVTR